jgi:hypothetical protein
MGHPRERVLTFDRVLDAARDMFLERMTVDMQELAHRLSVSRATLYRIATSRERVLGDVIWSLSVMSLRSVIKERSEPVDLRKVLEIGQLFRDITLDSVPMKRFVTEEPSTAAAVLHSRSPIRDQLVDEWRGLLIRATDGKDSTLTIDPQHAAEIVVNLGASTLYDDLVAGERREPDLVAVVLRSLFQ